MVGQSPGAQSDPLRCCLFRLPLIKTLAHDEPNGAATPIPIIMASDDKKRKRPAPLQSYRAPWPGRRRQATLRANKT